MLDLDYIDQAEFDDAMAEQLWLSTLGEPDRPATVYFPPPETDASEFPFFFDYVRRYLVERYGEDQVYRGGLQVETTIDPALQAQAEAAQHRADTGELRAAPDRDRIWTLEGRANVDAVLIAELQAEGIVTREHAANLEVALHSSRTIGAAIGILMARHNVYEAEAFQMLRRASMDTNRKLREVADEVVLVGDVPGRPG